MKNKPWAWLALVFLSGLLGFSVNHFYWHNYSQFRLGIENSDDTTKDEQWSEDFLPINIPGNKHGTKQSAYFLNAGDGQPQPLVVSLHTWSGNYTQPDALAPLIRNEGWNYIHPDFQGPNNTQDACLSERVIEDIDNAIQYAIDHGNVDLANIFVVGASGGGYATLGAYLRSRHQVRAFLSWAPISDLSSWYHQLSAQEGKYASDILACTASGQQTLNEAEASKRSPLHWNVPKRLPKRLEVYAGLDDGFEGSVPISHSIEFYNRIAKTLGFHDNLVTNTDTIKLLTRGIDRNIALGSIGDRSIFYRQDIGVLSLVIFDGGHEMLPEYSVNRIKSIATQID